MLNHRVKIGWAGDYRRRGKQFDLAYLVARELDAELVAAGPHNSRIYVEHSEMPEFYRSVDCLLVTSAFEAHPLVVYEALACGTPVLMERRVGDCYVNNVRGVFYYNGFDVDNICESVKYVVENRDALSREAVKCIRDEWTWDKVAPQYHEMVEAITDVENPSILWLADVRDWAWGFMGEDVKRYVFRDMDIVYTSEMSPQDLDMEVAVHDVVFNHPWKLVNHVNVPSLTGVVNLLCVANPAFIHPENASMFYKALVSASALTTVSKPIVDVLRFMGKPVFYATRGVNVELFHP